MPAVSQADASMLLNRELSWLDVNERVLDLAADPDQPLLERVKFCGIFSSTAWTLHPDGRWERIRPTKSEQRRPAQTRVMRRRERARRIGRSR